MMADPLLQHCLGPFSKVYEVFREFNGQVFAKAGLAVYSLLTWWNNDATWWNSDKVCHMHLRNPEAHLRDMMCLSRISAPLLYLCMLLRCHKAIMSCVLGQAAMSV